jgi:hypothetical protein
MTEFKSANLGETLRENPESIFWCDFDTLKDAGIALGEIRSSVVPPKTTFEALIERAR